MTDQHGTRNTLEIIKGRHRFCIRYQAGAEAKVLDALVEMVNRRDLPFDWFDAAVLSHQLGQRLAKDLNTKRSPPGPAGRGDEMRKMKAKAVVSLTVGKCVLEFDGERHEFSGGSSRRELHDGEWVVVPDPDLVPLKDAMGKKAKAKRRRR